MRMNGIVFDALWLLPLAVILPALAVFVIVHAHRQRQRRLARFGTLDVVSRLMPVSALTPPRWRLVRLGTASALVGIAVAGPRWGEERNVLRSRRVDTALLLT